MASRKVIQRGVTKWDKQRCDNDRKHHWDRQTKVGLTKIATSSKGSLEDLHEICQLTFLVMTVILGTVASAKAKSSLAP